MNKHALCVASVLLAVCGLASATTVETTLVPGPMNQATSTWIDFSQFKAVDSFNNNFTCQPAGMTLEEFPSAYEPHLTGETITTDRFIQGVNSHLSIYDASTPLGGGAVWSAARITDASGELTLESIRYERTVDGGPSGFSSDGVLTYEGTSYVADLTRTVVGYHYGADGLPGDNGETPVGTGDDTSYTSGNGSTPVHEIRIYADEGQSVAAGFFGGTGQTQLDAALAWLNAFGTWTMTVHFWVDNDAEGSNPEGSTTITIAPTTPAEGEGSVEGEFPVEGEGSVEGEIFEGELTEGEGSEGEGEGVILIEGEGSVEGEFPVEGEGSVEGEIFEGELTEGEGSEGEGEGVILIEGEGSVEGEFPVEGEGSVEGEIFEGELTEGEGSEGEGEGEFFEGEGSFEGEGEPSTNHSADTDGDGLINLSELLRCIQFYNSQGFHCNPDTPDGYSPGPGGDELCAPHSADYRPQDWLFNLAELLRMIQFFNTGYHACPELESEDGFCAGPAF